MINLDGSIVRIKFALANEIQIGGLAGDGHVSQNPGIGIIDGIRFDEAAVIVVVIHDPGVTKLTQVAGATGLLGPNFCFAENGKEQSGEDRDGCNNREQFDEGETAPVS